MSIESGIQYSNKGYRSSNIDVTNPTNAEIFGKANINSNFNYIDIPLKINYFLGKNKIRFISSLGLTSNILVNQVDKSSITYFDGKKENHKDISIYNYKHFNLSPMVSFGIDYAISQRTNLRIEPTFRYGVMKIIDAPITGYLWNGGVNVSYLYSF